MIDVYNNVQSKDREGRTGTSRRTLYVCVSIGICCLFWILSRSEMRWDGMGC